MSDSLAQAGSSKGLWKRMLAGGFAVAMIAATVACSGGATTVAQPTTKPAAPAASAPTTVAADPAKGSAPAIVAAKELSGAGASFPYPLYSKWFDVYDKEKGIKVNYQSVGSGAGIKQLTEKTVDFGASDAVMTADQVKAAGGGDVVHIPTVMGAVVVTYNVQGIDKGLKLTPDTLAGIYLGEIKKWNDPKLAADNPEMKLPDVAIAVVYRSDGSGTTNIFTDYLSNVSATWKGKVGVGTSVNFPVGLGAKGNEGVSGQVKQTPGAVGYVELAYAVQNKLPYAQLKNQAGKFLEATLESTTEAAAAFAANMPDNLRVSLVNAPGEKSYPIAAFTYLLARQQQDNGPKGKAVVDMFSWGIHDAQKYAKDLLYAPLPAEVVKKAEALLKTITFQGQALY